MIFLLASWGHIFSFRWISFIFACWTRCVYCWRGEHCSTWISFHVGSAAGFGKQGMVSVVSSTAGSRRRWLARGIFYFLVRLSKHICSEKHDVLGCGVSATWRKHGSRSVAPLASSPLFQAFFEPSSAKPQPSSPHNNHDMLRSCRSPESVDSVSSSRLPLAVGLQARLTAALLPIVTWTITRNLRTQVTETSAVRRLRI